MQLVHLQKILRKQPMEIKVETRSEGASSLLYNVEAHSRMHDRTQIFMTSGNAMALVFYISISKICAVE